MKFLLLNIILLFSFNLFAQDEQAKMDWANLHRFQQENTQIKTMTDSFLVVVFMGDSITQGWIEQDSAFFAKQKHYVYINRGISGQTTQQMLLRFRQDVLELNPSVVIILAGINDIAENTGHLSEEQIFGNIQSMAELTKWYGRMHDVRLLICSLLPAKTIPWRKNIEPIEKTIKLNKMIEDYCKQNCFTYVDYYSAMVDSDKGLKKEFGKDEVHPNLAGYKVMEKVLEDVFYLQCY